MPVWVQQAIDHFGYAAIFLLIAIEGVGIPLPGETALLVGGAAAGVGSLNITIVIIVAALGAIVGDNTGYVIGRNWGRLFVTRFGPRIGLTRERQAVIERFFQRYGVFAVFIGRYEAILRTYLSLVAGITEIPFRIFFPANILACIVWAVFYGLLSFHLGAQWRLIEATARRFGYVSVGALAAVVVLGIIVWSVRRKQAERAKVR
ncbi:MAG: DedA family protein [Chloroflexi bacterium]|nr:DedA family protein [Chloroflexota bacterium]